MNLPKPLFAAIATALAASLCCAAPLALLSFGIGGAWLAVLPKFEPFRPFFVGASLLLLFLSWNGLHRPKVCSAGTCSSSSARPERILFWIVALLVLALIVFPWLIPLLY